MLDAARKTIHDEAAAVAAVADQLDASFLDVLEQLLACTGKVFITGSGTSGTIARRMAHLLTVCGTPAAFLHPMDALHGTMGVLALTSKPESTMAQLADTVVTLHNREGADPGDVIAMGSTLVSAVWGDALAILLMRQRGYSWERMLETHPGGAVGKMGARPEALEPIR